LDGVTPTLSAVGRSDVIVATDAAFPVAYTVVALTAPPVQLPTTTTSQPAARKVSATFAARPLRVVALKTSTGVERLGSTDVDVGAPDEDSDTAGVAAAVETAEDVGVGAGVAEARGMLETVLGANGLLDTLTVAKGSAAKLERSFVQPA